MVCAQSNIGTKQLAPLVVSFFELLDLLVCIYVEIGKASIGVSVLGGL